MPSQVVMPGHVRAFTTDAAVQGKDVDGRVKPGQDDNVNHMFVSDHLMEVFGLFEFVDDPVLLPPTHALTPSS